MNDDLWQVRAAAWELAALSFRYPGDGLAAAVASGEWDEAAAEVLHALPAAPHRGLPSARGSKAEALAASELLHELRLEATRLFVGAPAPVVSPYEGVWRAPDDGAQALLFVSPPAMAVERFAKSCGLEQVEGSNEPFDHVSTECELLQYLSLRSLDGACASLLPIGDSSEAYVAFLSEHALVWMPAFAAAVASSTRCAFFRTAAAYLDAVAKSAA